jgi:hypothetical protein
MLAAAGDPLPDIPGCLEVPEETFRICCHGLEHSVQRLRPIHRPHRIAPLAERAGDPRFDVRCCSSGKDEHELLRVTEFRQVLFEELPDPWLVELRIICTAWHGEC